MIGGLNRDHNVLRAGVLAPAAKWRPLIVPESAIESAAQQDTAATTEAASAPDPTAASAVTSHGVW